MKRLLCVLLIIVLCVPAFADEVTFDEHMQQNGYIMYSIDKLESLGLDADTFSGDAADCSFFAGLYIDDQIAFFGRHKNGDLFVAKSSLQSILSVNDYLEYFGLLYTIDFFVRTLEAYDFSIGILIDSDGFRFGLSEDSETLKAVASKIGSGHPMTVTVGWENYRKLFLHF